MTDKLNLTLPPSSVMGFYIIKVLKKKESRQQTFAEVREQVNLTLRSEKENEVRQALYAQLKERYNVVVHTARFSKGNAKNVAEDGKKATSQGSGS